MSQIVEKVHKGGGGQSQNQNSLHFKKDQDSHSRILELLSFIDISSREQLSVTFLSLGSGLRSQVGRQVVLAVK